MEAGSDYKPKEELYEILENTNAEGKHQKKFHCLLCSRILASKQRILTHLYSAHNRSPLKRVKKLYLNDPTLPIPKRTLYFWKSRKQQNTVGDNLQDHGQQESFHRGSDSESDVGGEVKASDCAETLEKDYGGELKASNFVETSELDVSQSLDEQNLNLNFSNSESNYSSDSDASNEENLSSSSTSSESEQTSDSSDEEEQVNTELDGHEKFKFTGQQLQSLSIIAYILRHKLTGVAANDLLSLLKVIGAQSPSLNATKYEDLLKEIENVDFRVCHYCPCCYSVFPENLDIYACNTPNCQGYRYRGSLSAQTKPSRQPCHFFVVADIKSQLKNLLEQDSLFEKIIEVKHQAKLKQSNSSSISDITSGKYYHMLLEDGNFLANENTISGIFNTDGIPLYSSSSVKLWPIFLAINEIPLTQRFSRDNMILVGIWQGKGNPPFLQYLNAFGEEMCKLYYNGIIITKGNELVNVKLGILLGVLDLQAKGYTLNMTMHNGENGCCTCEEPGKSVKQGKGHARCYPYREREDRFPFRNSDHIKYTVGPTATAEKRLKGICGISGLMSMP